MIKVKEGSYINSDIVTVQMEVPKDEWEKIRSSEEWQMLLDSDAGNGNQLRREKDISRAKERLEKKLTLVDEIDKTIKSVCEAVQGKSMILGGHADTVKALATLIEARAKLLSY